MTLLALCLFLLSLTLTPSRRCCLCLHCLLLRGVCLWLLLYATCWGDRSVTRRRLYWLTFGGQPGHLSERGREGDPSLPLEPPVPFGDSVWRPSGPAGYHRVRRPLFATGADSATPCIQLFTGLAEPAPARHLECRSTRLSREISRQGQFKVDTQRGGSERRLGNRVIQCPARQVHQELKID